MSTEKRDNKEWFVRVCCLFAMSLNIFTELTPCAHGVRCVYVRLVCVCVVNTSNVKLKEKASQANSWVRQADLRRKTPHILVGTTRRSNSKWTARGTENKQETKMKLKFILSGCFKSERAKKKNSPCFEVNVIFATDMDGNKSFAGYIPVKGMKETPIFDLNLSIKPIVIICFHSRHKNCKRWSNGRCHKSKSDTF